MSPMLVSKQLVLLVVLTVALGVSGDAPEGENIARGKTIRQQETRRSRVFYYLTGGYKTCKNVSSDGPLKVDLENTCEINSVLFYGSPNRPPKDLKVEINPKDKGVCRPPGKGNEAPCTPAAPNSNNPQIHTFNCSGSGQFVSVRENGAVDFLVCEIQVYGSCDNKPAIIKLPVLTSKITNPFRTSSPSSLDRQLDQALSSNSKFLHDLPRVLDKIGQQSSQTLKTMKVGAKLSSVVKFFESYLRQICPCEARPLKDGKAKEYITIFSRLMISRGLANTNTPATCADVFPGLPYENATEEAVKIKFVGEQDHEFHSTSLYLPPGKTLKIEILSGRSEENFWLVKIGCHTDDIGRRPDWLRYRSIASHDIPVKLGDAFSGFGGIIWLMNTKKNTQISLKLSGAVRAPFFNLRDPKNMKEWDTKGRYYPAPWAEISGDKLSYCVPSSSVRKYDGKYLTNLMRDTWDLAVKGNFWLVGQEKRRKERFTIDVQISVGWGHSGYPIMAVFPWLKRILALHKYHNDTIDMESPWGVSHELGHNLQDSKWTFDATVEVTNNIFAYFDQYLWGRDFFAYQDGQLTSIRKYLNGIVNYESWKKDVYLALQVYRQTAFHFGWQPFRDVFLLYKNKYMNYYRQWSDQEKMDLWVKFFSMVTMYNLCPMYEFWGYPISSKTRKYLSTQYEKAFLPDDKITQLSPTRVEYIKKRYKKVKLYRKYSRKFDHNAVRNKVKTFLKKSQKNDVIYL